MNGVERRDFLKTFGAAGAGALALGAPRVCAGAEGILFAPTADTLILLWMAGGMAHTETFDPKKYTPFAPGIEARRVLSTFPAIDTAVDHIKFSKGLERIGSVMDRGTLIRSFKAADLDFVLHSRHQYHWHTGYIPPQTVAVPHIGAVIAKSLRPKNPDVPAFINIGEPLKNAGEKEALKAFLTAGFLGSEFGPFMVPDPKCGAGVPPALASAFNLSREREVYDKYNTGNFGLGCLLARRLTEVGARFIEVHYEYSPFGHWDTHDHGHTRTEKLKRTIDGPVAQLVLDLEERGLLNRTLIVLASEFGRAPQVEDKPGKPTRMMNPKHYGMHAHLAGAGSVLLFGGGIRKGCLYGKTADEHPCVAVENPVEVADLHATLFRAMGISPRCCEFEQHAGKPILELFA